MNLDDTATFLTVLIGGCLAASLLGALLAVLFARWRWRQIRRGDPPNEAIREWREWMAGRSKTQDASTEGADQ